MLEEESESSVTTQRFDQSIPMGIGKHLGEYFLGAVFLVGAIAWGWKVDTTLTEIVTNQRHATNDQVELIAKVKAQESTADAFERRLQKMEDTRFTASDGENARNQIRELQHRVSLIEREQASSAR